MGKRRVALGRLTRIYMQEVHRTSLSKDRP